MHGGHIGCVDGTAPANADSDGDTIDDSDEVGADVSRPRDTDGDGIIDALDDDDDNDGLSTADENAAARGAADPDGDGRPAWRDTDSDDDRALDGKDDGLSDSDGDGRADFLDRDSDSRPKSPPAVDSSDDDGCSQARPTTVGAMLAVLGLGLLRRRRHGPR